MRLHKLLELVNKGSCLQYGRYTNLLHTTPHLFFFILLLIAHLRQIFFGVKFTYENISGEHEWDTPFYVTIILVLFGSWIVPVCLNIFISFLFLFVGESHVGGSWRDDQSCPSGRLHEDEKMIAPTPPSQELNLIWDDCPALLCPPCQWTLWRWEVFQVPFEHTALTPSF